MKLNFELGFDPVPADVTIEEDREQPGTFMISDSDLGIVHVEIATYGEALAAAAMLLKLRDEAE